MGTDAPSAAPGGGRPAWVLPALLAALVFLLYLPSIRLGFVYDDETLILKEPRPASVGSFTGIFDQRHFPNLPYYRPVTRLTVRVQHALHGKNPAPFHLFNALLASLTALAAFGLLRREAFGLRPPAAFLASLLFAAHPVASSCVYPICSGRETLLPALLMLLAMRAWLGRGPLPRAGAVLLWIAALFAKEQAIVLPALFLAADRLDLGGDGRWKRPWRLAGWYLLMAAAAAGYLALRHSLFGGSEFAPAGQWGLPFLSYLYALQTAWLPFIPLVYEPRPDVWFSAWRAAAALAATGLLVYGIRRSRLALGRPALFWAAWFVVLQLPTANLLKQEALFDERYVFLAWLALPALAAALVSLYWNRPGLRRAAAGAGAALVIGAGLISLARAAAFRDDLAFSIQWARTSPRNPIAHNNEGNNWLARGRLDLAEAALNRALAINPDGLDPRYNLGLVQLRRGHPEAAAALFLDVLDRSSTYPARYNLALALAATGDAAGAEAQYRLALAGEPPHAAEAAYNLGRLLGEGVLPEEAIDLFLRAGSLNPADSDSPYNEGVTLERLDRLPEAMAAYRESLRRAPDKTAAHFNLANLLFRDGRYAEAAGHYEAVLETAPDDAQARLNRDEARRRASGSP